MLKKYHKETKKRGHERQGLAVRWTERSTTEAVAQGTPNQRSEPASSMTRDRFESRGNRNTDSATLDLGWADSEATEYDGRLRNQSASKTQRTRRKRQKLAVRASSRSRYVETAEDNRSDSQGTIVRTGSLGELDAGGSQILQSHSYQHPMLHVARNSRPISTAEWGSWLRALDDAGLL